MTSRLRPPPPRTNSENREARTLRVRCCQKNSARYKRALMATFGGEKWKGEES
jgi:hypothetical protein